MKKIELEENEVRMVKAILQDQVCELECYVPTYNGKDKEDILREIEKCKKIIKKLS
ncbi:MAG: hypothetical protein IKP50_03985 [Bacilli bacterium]|nr:hypothetical protein [Bacilli bacterium]